MQTIFINRKITGKTRPHLNPYHGGKTRQELISDKQRLRQERVIKEIHYFKSKIKAETYIKLDQEKDPKSHWGEIWPDKRTMRYAVYKYRKY
jgi:hypothetical protein